MRSRLLLSALFSCACWLLASGAEGQHAAAPESISLRALLEKALSDPPRVLSTLAALARSDAEHQLAQAAYFPSFSAQGTAGITYDNRQVLPGEPERIDSVYMQTGATANLDWSLINLARRNTIAAASSARSAVQQSVSEAQRSALAGAAELYMRALTASQIVSDAELTLERRSQQHEGISGLVRAGLRPPVDETRARIELLAARYRLEVRRIDERAAFASLASAVGRDPHRPLRPEPLAGSPFVSADDPNQASAAALDHRPELKSLKATLGARQSELNAALMRRLPTLGFLASGSVSYFERLNENTGFDGYQYGASALGYLRFQGFDPALWRSAKVANAAVLQAQRAFENTWLSVQAEVVEAQFAVERGKAELERAIQVLAAAEATREAQTGRYKTGVASLLELLDAEAVEQTARLDRIQAERDQEIARIRLLASTGLILKLVH